MDIEKIKYEFGDDIEIFSELVDDFKIESKKMIADIEKFISDKEYHQLMIVAHTYKGVVANFYSNEIEECAFKLEKMGREEDISNAQNILIKLIELDKILITELESFLNEKKAS
tara:strand:+ start:17614 stop:17955 length:342 start_codon:yes stop_codon:yes gene_type:complete